MFLIIKKDPGKNREDGHHLIYDTTVNTPEELADHIKACYAHTDQEIISVVNVSATDQ